MAKVIIFGNTDWAEVIYFYLKHDSDHEVVGFTVDEDRITSDSFQQLPVVSYQKLEQFFSPLEYKLFIPISYQKLNKLRAEKYADAKERGYQFISYISSKAIYYGTPVGENCCILENNIIQPHTVIGNNCIIAQRNNIGHHCVIDDHCFITSDAVIGGGTVIGAYTFVGLNATIRNYIKIGKENIIGAGAMILSNTEDRAVYSPGETPKFEVPSNFVRI